MPPVSRTRAWWRTAEAALLLCLARLLVALVPFRLWRRSLGPRKPDANPPDLAELPHLVAHIRRASWRLPFEIKCLPQAMVLGWQLRRRGVTHRMVFALRPPDQRHGRDMLHAWIECDGRIVLGELPGPWLQVLVLPQH